MAIRKIWLVTCIDIETINGGGGARGGQAYARKEIPNEFYLEERHARNAAERLAQENPMKPYAVMIIDQVLETGKAPVITKKFNPEGELVPA